jgi:hypothetical protein
MNSQDNSERAQNFKDLIVWQKGMEIETLLQMLEEERRMLNSLRRKLLARAGGSSLVTRH